MTVGLIQTKMAYAFTNMVNSVATEVKSGERKLSREQRHLVGHVLTNNAKGIGVKFRPRLSLKKKDAADSAVEGNGRVEA